MPELRYSVILQLQLVAENKVKVLEQAVQVLALVQVVHLLIAEEQKLHCPEAKY
jgi:hypothetical protein